MPFQWIVEVTHFDADTSLVQCCRLLSDSSFICIAESLKCAMFHNVLDMSTTNVLNMLAYNAKLMRTLMIS